MALSYIAVRLCSAAAIAGGNITHNGYTIESIANAVLTIDGVAVLVGDWVVLKDQVDTTQNGLFQMTQLGVAGGAGAHYIIVRAGWGSKLYHNMTFHIMEGTINAGRVIRLATADPITAGSTNLPNGDFLDNPFSIVGDLTGDVLANGGQLVLDNGTNGTDATVKANIIADNNGVVLTHGATDALSLYKGNVLADNNDPVLIHGATGALSTYKGNVLADDDAVVLVHGATGALSTYTGDILADNAGVVLTHGATDALSLYKGNIIANDNAVVLVHGATGVASTYKGNILADNDAVVLTHGATDLLSLYKGNIIADDNGVVLTHGATSALSLYKGNILADDNAVVLTHGATGLLSLYTGTVSAINNISLANLGAVGGAGIVAVENGDAYHHRTLLTITNLAFPAIPGVGALAFGTLLYTLPVGNAVVEMIRTSLAFTCSGPPVNADVMDFGAGTALAAGAVATLNLAGAGAENIETGQAALVPVPAGATYNVLISNQILSVLAANAHTIYLNNAGTWSGADTIVVNGTVVIDWLFL